ncbi:MULTISPECIES: hypothetical protein [unclassified Pseudomonas]|uniref:hypothetical protein n=1 Tax=unclassified Pseudomonas TaxID=196821 RepID=UPI000A1D9B7E|nr:MULTISPECIES: hypothetical protein [unclassified Pseudomonas]POA51186.1 hypothetical protein C1889_28405 [Pseudomonas sp. FW507-12TSA]
MKRIVGITLCLVAAYFVQAEHKLRVMNLGDDPPPSAGSIERGKQYVAAQDEVAKIKPEEAREFLKRLNETVEHGQTLALTGAMNNQQASEQALALKRLQDESDRYGALFTPYAKCRTAAIDAASSWQGMILKDARRYSENYAAYQVAARQCANAAD